MLVHVTVHVDLRPHDNREHFNDLMSEEGWNKQLVVFTIWYQPFDGASVDAARNEAIKKVRMSAKAAGVNFDGVVVAGNTAPVPFGSGGAGQTAEEVFASNLMDYVMPGSRKR